MNALFSLGFFYFSDRSVLERISFTPHKERGVRRHHPIKYEPFQRLPPTTATVRVEFIEPTSTRVAGAISLIGLLAIALLLSRAESADVLVGVDESADHAAIVPSVLIHDTNPI